MHPIHSALTATVLLLPLAAIGLAAARRGSSASRVANILIQITLAGIVIFALAGLAIPEHTLSAITLAVNGHDQALSLGLRFAHLGLGMAAFIAAIGLVVHRYAGRYLRDDVRGGGFQATLALVVAAALSQALSPGLVQFALGWIAASFGLQRMLRHERDRPAAILAADTKFLVSRLGDAAMAGAIAALLIGPGTTDFSELSRILSVVPNDHQGLLLIAGLAVVLAVACKTALAPFQQWLIGTIEAPTPLSALLHAGVVNAGGFLVICLSPLFAQAPVALTVLMLVGLVSALIGPLAMWAQTDLKRSLAWSTVGQMGFMIVQCGIGAYGAAFLHLVGHGCYKADAFLRSGTLSRAVEARPVALAIGPSLGLFALGVAVAGAVLALTYYLLALTYHLLGVSPQHLHGGLTLLAIQALALGQMVATPTAGGAALPLRLLVLVPAGAIYASLTWGIETLISGHVTAAPALSDRGLVGAVLAVALPVLLALLAGFWVLLPRLSAHPRIAAWRVHAGNGFYLPHLAERVVRSCRPRSL